MPYRSEGFAIMNAAPGTVEIDILGDIGGNFWTGEGKTVDQLNADLKAVQAVSADNIIVNIASLGGFVDHALAMHDMLASNQANVTVNVIGMTASAATIIAMAGDTIRMSENARFLIHRATGFTGGHADNMINAGKDMQKIEDSFINIYAKKTGNTVEQIKEWMNADDGNGMWWSPEEAKENGFVNEIYEPMRIAAQATKEQIKAAGLPIPKKKSNAMNFKEELQKFKTDLLNEVKGMFKNAKPEEAPDYEGVINAKVEEITAQFEEKVEGLQGEVEALTQARDTAYEAYETEQAETKRLKAELAKATGKKSGAEADADPPAGNPKPEEPTAFEKQMAELANMAKRSVRDKLNA